MGAQENAIQNSIIEYLRLKGLKAGRLNNAPIFDGQRKVFRKAHKYSFDGLPDIAFFGMGAVRGNFGFVECKTITGTTSLAQRDFLASVAKAGGTAILARGLTEVMDVIAKQVAPEAETGVYIPSGKWRLRK